ncbi:MAG: M3 family metallopeptidase [Thermoplasmatota archaeon]
MVVAAEGLDALTREWERREEALSLEYYRQYAGLAFDEAQMGTLAAEIETVCRDALRSFPREALAEPVFVAMIGNTAAREQTRLQNEVYRKRDAEVATDVAGERVNLNNVRLFNAKHARDAGLRRHVFDALMEKARALTPTLAQRFALSAATYARYGLTPLSVYCVDERVPLARLKEVVDASARRARPEFERLGQEISEEVLGKPMEYFDDMYVYRHTVFAPVDPAFAAVPYVERLAATARDMGFPVERIAIDGEPRAGKYSSPVCFGVKIPGDVRVLYQRTSPFSDYESFYHEMGHGLHFISVDARRDFAARRLIPNGVAEIFSTLFEELAVTPAYLIEDLGLPESLVADAARRRRFMELYFLTVYGANSMHNIRVWEEKLYEDLDRADAAYEELTARYMGVRVPGRYWQTHHILSMSDMYAPSYLLANIRKSELIRVLEKRFGDRWWRERAAGEFLRDTAMGPGGDIDLDAFSRLDADAYLKHVLGS